METDLLCVFCKPYSEYKLNDSTTETRSQIIREYSSHNRKNKHINE
jgi:hypothetical protein